MTLNMRGLAAEFGLLFVELLVMLAVVSTVLALAVRCTGLGRLQRWLGGSARSAALKGLGLGFIVPFCTYSAIPMLVGMVDARVRTATWGAFLLAAPLLDPIVLAVLIILFGWQATVGYTAFIAAAVVVLALLADAAGVERWLRPAPRRVGAGTGRATGGSAAAACVGDPFVDERPWRGLRREMPLAGKYAWELVRALAVPMAVAVAIAATIVGFVPDQLVARLAGPDNPLAVPAAAVLGAPFYVSTEAFLPIASALHTNGMGLGAAFALVISAAGINLPELALLARTMRPRLLFAYAAAVVGAAMFAGYLVPLVA
ncbi:hypothetical protein ER308_11345 [Egibacter rhizosphaerae]|uniref:Permease n=1 Tax=Egibacter rhizosphaerae TaxID=1670831 RepID=A0A411YFZ8_9ACTN|nr:permease [Egibacter rhizosphaerae]QBI20099.1 hypothetical protein ER308_11345 [Egibacter rhizosphaerae]